MTENFNTQLCNTVVLWLYKYLAAIRESWCLKWLSAVWISSWSTNWFTIPVWCVCRIQRDEFDKQSSTSDNPDCLRSKMHFNERSHCSRHRFLPGIWRPGSAEHIYVSLRVSFEQYCNYSNFYAHFYPLWLCVSLKLVHSCLLSFLGVYLIARNRPKIKQQDRNFIAMDKIPGELRLSPKVNCVTCCYPWFMCRHRQWPWLSAPANARSLGSRLCLMSSAVHVHREKAHR